MPDPTSEAMSDLRIRIPSLLKAQAIDASDGKLTQWIRQAIAEKLGRNGE